MITKIIRGLLIRNLPASAMNLLGLSVAFAAFMVIMIQVDFETNFDRMHKNEKRIFRLDVFIGADSERSCILGRGMIDAVDASSAYIVEKTLLNPWIGGIHFTVGDSTNLRGFNETVMTCYPNITRIFDFKFTEGDPDCLVDPEKIIIPASMARRFFGNNPAVGQSIQAKEYVWTKRGISSFTVGGVYKDFPGNTQLNNVIYSRIDNTMEGDWAMRNFLCYILTSSSSEGGKLEAELNRSFDFGPDPTSATTQLRFSLLPLRDIYFKQAESNAVKTGNVTTVRVLMAIAFLLIFIAAVNFTNFSIALAPMRMKSLNTRIVMGSRRGDLRRSLTLEAIALALISWGAAVFIVHLLGENSMLPFIEADTSLLNVWPTVLVTGAVALGTGLIAGIYPAMYATSFQPAMALKGNFGLSPAGRSLRTWLTGFQYFISIGLIIGAMFIRIQGIYMKQMERGFDKEQIAIAKIGGNMFYRNRDALTSLLKQDPVIENVAFTQQKLGGTDTYSYYQYKTPENEIYAQTLIVTHTILDVMGIKVTEGRSFLPSEEHQGGRLAFVINKLMKERLNLNLGDRLSLPWMEEDGEVVGIVEAPHLSSARHDINPMTFVINAPLPCIYIYARLKAGTDPKLAADHIRKSIAAIDPSYPVDVEFFDQVYKQLYEKEENLNTSITMLAILAVILSVTGVFGLTLFETQYRRKEIGIRKVFGATAGNILSMFNRTYFRIVCICFVPAAVVAWYAVNRWLEGFAQRTPLHWWVFLASFAIISFVTALTVSFRNYSASRMNPVESIGK
ncbi:MAG: ABC transporter permease [Tannerellaceae bacterium]|jgi:putative ABC transport system permease protein|nr:ABC transporter permease [Tannerellaceae bacterium]